jgi:hypothetical protein
VDNIKASTFSGIQLNPGKGTGRDFVQQAVADLADNNLQNAIDNACPSAH